MGLAETWGSKSTEELIDAFDTFYQGPGGQGQGVLIQAELTRRLILSNEELRSSIDAFRRSSDRASSTLIRLTWTVLL